MLIRGLAVFGLVLAVVGGTAALGSAAGAADPAAQADPVSQAEQPDRGPVLPPSDSDDEVRLVMALLIAVAVIALLGTFVYWVRVGAAPRRGRQGPPDSPAAGDTLG